MEFFEIAFSGQQRPEADPLRVREAIQRLFNADERLMAQLFSGRRMVIKQKVDLETARKYQKAFSAAGAVLEVRPVVMPEAAARAETGQAVEPVVAGRPEQPGHSASGPQASQSDEAAHIVPRDEYMAAFVHVRAPSLGIAPAGSPLLDSQEQPPLPEVDISGISLAPPGSDMGYLQDSEEAVIPDVSHIRLAD